MSGGGRCNFTNLFVSADNFVGANPHFCKSALNRYTQWDFIAMVERHQIEYEERKHGQLFCVHSAKDILRMLVSECELAGVEIETDSDMVALTRQSTEDGGRYQLDLVQGNKASRHASTFSCESLIVATGALSIPSLGGSGKGYDIAAQFGLQVLPRRAGLVPFMFSDGMQPLCERLSGLSLEVEVSGGSHAFTEQLLFTHRGISGPAVLQISNYWSPGDEVWVNVLPQLDASDYLRAAKVGQGAKTLRTVLSQLLPKALVAELQALWWPAEIERPLAEYSLERLREIGERLNSWRLKPSATEGYRTAELTLGGVDTNELSSKTMQAKQQAGLFFVGEVVDVSGHLGGFNFQWAWSSGYTAGLFA